uniref:Ribosomal protein S19 n=1 Tax=Tsukubamonas globosa TaxID=875863 RepID=W8VKH4_9EUKA|nr:ribosomal protein S19 [Tsukubamonas globosa]BAO51951.1 ribosomal protein S19 [Tsukubamonas globosa]
MTRGKLKGIFIDNSLLDMATKNRVKSWSRRSTVLSSWIGKRIDLYNGQKFVPVTVRSYMVGHKLGEYAYTRKKCIHKKKTQKRK